VEPALRLAEDDDGVAAARNEEAGRQARLELAQPHQPERPRRMAELGKAVAQVDDVELVREMRQRLDDARGLAAPAERLEDRHEAGGGRRDRLELAEAAVAQRGGEGLVGDDAEPGGGEAHAAAPCARGGVAVVDGSRRPPESS
jgi:hypothetical protein